VKGKRITVIGYSELTGHLGGAPKPRGVSAQKKEGKVEWGGRRWQSRKITFYSRGKQSST